MTATSRTNDPLRQVRRISRLMVWGCWAALVVMPWILVLYWVGASDATLVGHANLSPAVLLQPLQPWQRVAGALVMGIPMALLLMGVWQARRCFSQFAQGQVFTTQATALLRRFAGWVAAAALAALLAGSVMSVVLTWHNPPGMRQLAVGFSSSDLFAFFFAGLVWLMAAVIGQGQALNEENQGFV